MNVTRPSFVALALMAQVLAGFVPCGVVLCVHDDGRSVIELATALCCKAEDGGKSSCPSQADRRTPGPGVPSDEDHCRDFPLPGQQILPSTPSRECGAPARPSHPDAPLVLASLAPGSPIPASREPARGGGPPPGTPLQHLRTVVHRC